MQCSRCKQPKKAEDFYYKESGRVAYYQCKSCIAEKKVLRKVREASENIYFNIDKESRFYQY